MVFRFLGLNTVMAYQRAKVSAFKIVSTRAEQPASANDGSEMTTVIPNRSTDGGGRSEDQLPTSDM